ncbi:hypothetical protein [Clostridium sp. CH2]|uniref:hypothetical protein n=1 Tax=Clostridium sp. CH2 TaxID=2949990 RepID=UPI002079608D|nr:hypothetical protein [Clostridium sp. CH2]
MMDFTYFKSHMYTNISINSIDIFAITYDDTLKSFVEDIIKFLPEVKITIYFNLKKHFKDFIYINNIFNKIIDIENLKNISLKLTVSNDRVFIINKNINNIFFCNEFNRTISINSDIFTTEKFDLKLLAMLYKIYVTSKGSLYDFEFKSYYDKNNTICLNAANIPQFSSFKHAHTTSTEFIAKNKSLTYIQLGALLNPTGQYNETAQKKYGENHGKFSNLLDFSCINNGRNNSFSITPLGDIYLDLSETDKQKLLKFQLYKLYITQLILTNKISTKNELLDMLSSSLSLSTAKRRFSNVKSIVKLLELY